MRKQGRDETETTTAERSFGQVADLYGEVKGQAEIDNATGKAAASVYVPYTYVPAEKIGEVVYLLQRAAEWAIEKRDELVATRAEKITEDERAARKGGAA